MRRVHSLTNTTAVAVVTDCYDYIVLGSTAVAYVFSITSTLPLCFHLLITDRDKWRKYVHDEANPWVEDV